MTFWGGVFTLWCIVSFNASGFVKAKASWVSFRDSNIIKQGFDFSCGAASLATILTFFYNEVFLCIDDKNIKSIQKFL